jgi:hypothetical protein
MLTVMQRFLIPPKAAQLLRCLTNQLQLLAEEHSK